MHTYTCICIGHRAERAAGCNARDGAERSRMNDSGYKYSANSNITTTTTTTTTATTTAAAATTTTENDNNG